MVANRTLAVQLNNTVKLRGPRINVSLMSSQLVPSSGFDNLVLSDSIELMNASWLRVYSIAAQTQIASVSISSSSDQGTLAHEFAPTARAMWLNGTLTILLTSNLDDYVLKARSITFDAAIASIDIASIAFNAFAPKLPNRPTLPSRGSPATRPAPIVSTTSTWATMTSAWNMTTSKTPLRHRPATSFDVMILVACIAVMVFLGLVCSYRHCHRMKRLAVALGGGDSGFEYAKLPTSDEGAKERSVQQQAQSPGIPMRSIDTKDKLQQLPSSVSLNIEPAASANTNPGSAEPAFDCLFQMVAEGANDCLLSRIRAEVLERCNDRGETLLHCAIQHHNLEAVDKLLRVCRSVCSTKSLDILMVTDHKHRNAAHMMATLDEHEIWTMLSVRDRRDLMFMRVADTQNTIFHLAAREDNVAFLQTVFNEPALEKEANALLLLENMDDQTALMVAQQQDSIHCIELLQHQLSKRSRRDGNVVRRAVHRIWSRYNRYSD
eukprot:TRINITY_DN7571_c0_g1_i2.p1 TRINITY_DN7571_c0_g1~~TRINITY_DN7571_c0_g1_i2.p1  ORF type:complete len:517 (+),score=59.91 TRINITY_DN7571_c0_g1_i2:74-1552(+)